MKLSDAEAREKIRSLNGWSLVDGSVVKRFKFDEYMEGINFVLLVAGISEEADHHPEMVVGYKTVEVRLRTLSENGVTEKDFALAGKIDKMG